MSWLAVAAFVLLMGVALVAAHTSRRRLFAVAKPATTLSLLLVAGVPLHAPARWLCAGLVLSTAGDIALLSDSTIAFAVGLTWFAAAHLAYVAGCFAGAAWSTSAAAAALLAVLLTAQLLRRVLPVVSGGLRPAVLAYGVIITAMVATAAATAAGPWSATVRVALVSGAALFYASDAVLAWNRFVAPVPRGQTLTLLLYWSGQLGFAVAAAAMT